ncbi:MAG: hypothetical protein PHR24_00795 [Oscillospiraceae bacterium]|nr:hypothetical protein [Oscillospiraceae bacterium]MDD3833004.1 hypothetical protein [Oscillospiraceae bacterium]MDD4545815.1 hypothetical protein [Oscillospiraceae bacterium]
MKFGEFAGNEEVKQLLSSFVDGGRIPHALLIEGPIGSGRRTLARIIARAALCTSSSEKPCGVCAHCIKSAGDNHPDIQEIADDGKANPYKKALIKDMRNNAYVTPNEAQRRVIILPDMQRMDELNQNVLLKILEEPPEYLVFIITCENRSQLLATVQSRIIGVCLGSVENEIAARIIRQILPDTSKADALQAATVFGGIIGQAAAGLSDGSYRNMLELAPEFALAVIKPDELELLRLTGKLEKGKDTADGVLNVLGTIFRDAIVRRTGIIEDLSCSPQTAQTLAASLTSEQLMKLMNEVESLKRARRQYVNHRLFQTLMCCRLRMAAGR